MSIVERQVREMALLGFERFRVWVSPQSAADVIKWRSDLHRLYFIDLRISEISAIDEITGELEQVEGDVLLLEGDLIYDDRVLYHLVKKGAGSQVIGPLGERAVYLGPVEVEEVARKIREGKISLESHLADAINGDLDATPSRDIGYYVASLRLTMEPLMRRVSSDADLAPLARLMFRRTFKGVIDAVARYGYYHLVRIITGLLSRTSVSPNFLTLLSILGIWMAIPCFAFGYLSTGVVVAWGGVLMDSVDGKLARLRLHLTDTMGAFEHFTAAPGLALWYAAFGWHLNEVQAGFPGGEFWWTSTGIVLFVLDKLVSGGFKKLYGKEIFDLRPFDARFHLVAARRNITLLILTIGAIISEIGLAFQVAVAWMAITFGYHFLRLLQVVAGRWAQK